MDRFHGRRLPCLPGCSFFPGHRRTVAGPPDTAACRCTTSHSCRRPLLTDPSKPGRQESRILPPWCAPRRSYHLDPPAPADRIPPTARDLPLLPAERWLLHFSSAPAKPANLLYDLGPPGAGAREPET